MKAVTMTSFGQPPRYGAHAEPMPNNPDERLVEAPAAALRPVTRGRASGEDYCSAGGTPLTPSVEGVGRGTDGELTANIVFYREDQ